MGMGTGTGRGGWRPGAGRPKGSQNRRTVARLEILKAAAEDLELPLPRLLRRMNDASLPDQYRDSLAVLAAPYCHPRLVVQPRLKRLSEMTDDEIRQQIAWAEEDELRQGVGRGQWPRPVN